MRGAARVGAAAVLGVALVFAFPPYGVWPLAVLAFAGFALLLREARPLLGAAVGTAFGLGLFLPLLHWSGIFVGALPWVLLAISQAAFVAAFGALAGPLSRLAGWPLWIAALWTAHEAARSRLPFGGFPWGRLAFSQADAPTVRLAALGGAPLVTFAVALAGCLLSWAVHQAVRRRFVHGAVAVILAVLVVLSGLAVGLRPASGPSVTVAVVQGNVPRLGLDFNAQRSAVLRNHVDATIALADRVRAGTAPQPDLVIWPENASDIDPLADPEAAGLINTAVRAIGVPVLVGAVLDGPGHGLSNAGIVWDPQTGPGKRYLKRHPVPFGEYIPLRPIARVFSSDVDRVARGFIGGPRPGVLDVGPAKVGDVICFEVAYDSIVRDTVTRGADVLVVQTNNATFGRSGETQQQLAMGRLRAVEHGRTVIVAATSGISAVIAPDGHVVVSSKVFTRDLLVRSVRLSKSRTWASRVGALPEWLLTLTALAALAGATAKSLRDRRRRR
ncbi:MAG: apolipoprotein N-acyltransferase [Actinomycetota bacterium]|nr:apolipoprotein N-acyltransferase [Actinomycetota bacterium]